MEKSVEIEMGVVFQPKAISNWERLYFITPDKFTIHSNSIGYNLTVFNRFRSQILVFKYLIFLSSLYSNLIHMMHVLGPTLDCNKGCMANSLLSPPIFFWFDITFNWRWKIVIIELFFNF